MKLNRHRRAFSMMVALFLILLLSAMVPLIFNMSAKLLKETTTQYQSQQAVLLANSYTEFAIMAVMANDRRGTQNCLGDIGGTIGTPASGNGYKIRIRIAYIGNENQVGNCANTRIFYSDNTNSLATPLTIIVDVYVEYKEPDHHNIANAPWLTFHRRTVQKI